MTSPITLPVLLPLSTAVVCLLLRHRRGRQRAASVAGALGHLGAGAALLHRIAGQGIEVLSLGAWPAPFGITLVADLLAAVMVLVVGVVGTAVVVYSLDSVGEARESSGFHPLVHVLLAGASIAFLTGDLFNLYVGFEIVLMSSFVLLALGGARPELEGGVKYVTLNLVASALFLAAVGVLYGVAGTLNLADLAGAVRAGTAPGLVTTIAGLLLVAFGVKAAVFPLFFWLPASYHTPPPAVSALFAGLLSKVGVYALVRAFTLVFVTDAGFTHGLLLVCAGATMVTGVLGAASQSEFRRILAFHSVSQVGYMVLGLGLLSPLGLAGTVLFLVHHAVVKTNLFFLSGVVRRVGGSFALADLGGVLRVHPFIAVLFLVTAASLVGIPPASGFWAKLVLVQAGIDGGHGILVTVALAVGLLTLYSMTKIWNEVFWKAMPVPPPAGRIPAVLLGPVVALAMLTILLGMFAGPVAALAQRTGEQLADPSHYVRAVLGAPEAP